jgi:hypothetical protein
LKNENLEEVDLHTSEFPEEVIKTSPFLGEHYARICLSALRQALKSGLGELAESSIQKVSQAFSILRQCRHDVSHDVIDKQRLNSEVYYTLGMYSTDS